MSNSITGTVENLLPLQEFPSGFSKRVVVVNTGGDYPQSIPVEFHKDRVSVISGLTKGQQVTVSFDVLGNEYNGKYYSTIKGYRLEKGKEVEPETNVAKQTQTDDQDEDDDIPF